MAQVVCHTAGGGAGGKKGVGGADDTLCRDGLHPARFISVGSLFRDGLKRYK